MFKKNNKYFENKKYLLKLLDILNQDIYSIYFWFRRIYNLDFTYPTISKLIKDIILLILFILPLIKLMKLFIFIYKHFSKYCLLILDVIVYDFIFQKKIFLNIDKKYFLSFRNILQNVVYDFWFDTLLGWKYLIIEYFTVKNISLFLIKIITRILFVIMSSPLNFIYKFYKFIKYLYKLFDKFIDNMNKFIKFVISLIIKIKLNIKNKIKSFIILFKFIFDSIIWYMLRSPKFIKINLKLLKRWYKRWVYISLRWYYFIYSFYLYYTLEEIKFFFLALFYFKIREKRVLELVDILDFTYRRFFWNYDKFFKIPLKNLSYYIRNIFYDLLLFLQFKYIQIIYKIKIYYINIKIIIYKIIPVLFYIILFIIELILPNKLLYFINFIFDLIYNKIFKIKYETYKLNQHYNNTINLLKKNDRRSKNLNNFIKWRIFLYEKKKQIQWNVPLIRNTDSYKYIFINIANFIIVIKDIIKLIIFIIIIIIILYNLIFLNL